MVVSVQTFSEQMFELDIVKLLRRMERIPEKKDGWGDSNPPTHPFFRSVLL
jgi:hypothetical protein